MSCSLQPLGSPIRLKDSTRATLIFSISRVGIEGLDSSNERSWTYHSLQTITKGIDRLCIIQGQIGSIGRSNRVMTHFLTEYPGLRDVYTSITGNPDSTSEYVADTILQLLASERDTKMPPAHWLSSADLRSAKSMRRLCSPTQLTCISTPVSRRLSKLKLRKMDHLPGATAIRVQVDKAIAWRREDV
jgi:hypothetical protein